MLTGETTLVGPEVDRAPASFTLPQFATFAQGTPAYHFPEFDLKPEVPDGLRDRLPDSRARSAAPVTSRPL